MYEPGRGDRYLAVGLSALQCIEHAMDGRPRPTAVLDFAGGYGRVLRFLRAYYPQARLVMSEIEAPALSFCARAFGVEAFPSASSLADVAIPYRFDLIWCGSLLTHLPRVGTTELLGFFRAHLTDGGTCVFSAHGRVTEEALRTGGSDYGLTPDAVARLLEGFAREGYGYADYAPAPGYGVSLVRPDVVTAMATEVGLVAAGHQVAAWDDHHDVYAFTR
jgi:SAM-dependent methyltransferase